MNISFVIPVLNGAQYIKGCIESILKEMAETDEIIVVDNGSTDSTVSIVRNYKNIKLVVYPELSIAALRNRGVAQAVNEFLAFIDADCMLCDGWRRYVVRAFEDESVHSAGSRYDLPTDAGWIEKAWFSQRVSQRCKAEYINSGNLVVRRYVFEKLDGFDEKLVTDEDCDFGNRLNMEGFCMIEDPFIRAVHLGNPKSLREFYLKEAWHATSALASRSQELDRPTFMSLVFGVSLLVAFCCITASMLLGVNLYIFGSIVLLVPALTATYRAYQYKIYRYIPALTVLWGISFLARLRMMLVSNSLPRSLT